ncbi:MAG: acyl transferase [Chitinophagaceae bacterium]|nr:acyl transferase [Chitinophagaceae bacterium]
MEKQGFCKILDAAETDFEGQALAVFRRQYAENPVYRDYVNALGVIPGLVRSLSAIPFLPIRFFKTHKVVTGVFEPQHIFESSGTTGMVNSRHYIKDRGDYETSFMRGFEKVYGSPEKYCVLGLLPSYLERGKASSLVFMVDALIRKSGHPDSGFYLREDAKLAAVLEKLEKAGQPSLLIGVSFALLDFAEKYSIPLNHTRIIETGGMKGRREELIRATLHERLQKAFGPAPIHAEYGMTELLSQAWSQGEGIFLCPPWLKVLVREEEDPLRVMKQGSGAINIIDLANQDSCAFIATDDAGRVQADGSFEVLGRMDGSDLRGCSLLVMDN